MKERNIKITLDKAREWYNSDNESLKGIALQAFDKDELEYSFRDITNFRKACEALKLDCSVLYFAENITTISKASAAMFKLSIVRKALNWGQDLHLTKDPKGSYFYYPFNPFVTKSSTYYEAEINFGKIDVIGKIKSEGEEYYVLGGGAGIDNHAGLGHFNSNYGVGDTYTNIGFLGCANEEIAKHFGKYFGMLITEAKYGDLEDFEIVEEKYKI